MQLRCVAHSNFEFRVVNRAGRCDVRAGSTTTKHAVPSIQFVHHFHHNDMAPKRRRPNAFEVSFPDEAIEASFEATSLGKRKADDLFSVSDHQVSNLELLGTFSIHTSSGILSK